VANIPHAFAVQSFTDELAPAAGRDRVDYLLELLGSGKIDTRPPNFRKGDNPYMLDTARNTPPDPDCRGPIRMGQEEAGQRPARLESRCRSFLTYVGTVVEVEVDKGKIRIPRVDIALGTGLVVNPDRVRVQFEGASVFGTSFALMGEITAANGRIQESNFDNHPVARINEVPVETHLPHRRERQTARGTR
jgi:isoquinoline 1-oxidoreductase beta subunit